MEEIPGLTRKVLDRARRSRDPRFDGRFFIAVRSTWVYCRPICPTRLSNDSNVRYYATAEEAESAGYRPCLRCRPEAAPGSPAWNGTSAVVQRALRLIQDGALDHASLSNLANQLGIGVRHLSRLFTRHLGASPAAIAQTRRIHFAKRLLDDTSLSITDIAHAAGFGSIRRFNDAFQKTYRRPPRELRKRRRIGVDKTANAEIVLRLAYRPPYDWEHMQLYLAASAIPGVEAVTAEAYSRAVATPSGYCVLQVRRASNTHSLEVRVRGAMPAELPPLLSTVRRMFDLTADPRHIRASLGDDALLAPLLARRPGLRIPGAWHPFECCISAIVTRLHGGTGRGVLKRIVERFGTPIDVPGVDIRYLFPTAAVLAEAPLREVGLSRSGCQALQQSARGVRDKFVRFGATGGDEVRRMLCALPGFGRWTAGYVALRGIGEPDAFPSGDLLLRRLVSSGEKLLTSHALDQRAQRWRPFRGYAVLHLWGTVSTAAPNRISVTGSVSRAV